MKKFLYLNFLKLYLDLKFFMNNLVNNQKLPFKRFRDFKVNNSNTFFGYHDKISLKNGKLLSHENKGDKYFVGYFDQKQNFNRVKKTSLCSWQLGSQLQWVDKNLIAFNCEKKNKPISIFYDLKKKKTLKSFSQLIFNVDNKKKNFISLNFQNLYKSRDGYGYDLKKFDNLKISDDLIIVNIKKKKILHVIKKNFLIKNFKNFNFEASHFNHATFSPSGKSILFFLVDILNKERKILVFRFHLSSKKINFIKEIKKISHYCWLDDKKILFTELKKKNFSEYKIFNFENRKIFKINLDLELDGHPMINPKNKNLFVTDTYPNKFGYQKLLVFDLKKNKIVWETSLKFSTSFLFGSRCDLHPKWDDSGKKIVIDFAVKNQRFIRVYDYLV